MANRTIQFLGQGYAPAGTDPIIITATLDGNVVYTGTIPTVYTSDISRDPASQQVLFTCELPIEFSGTVPMSIDLDNPVGVSVLFEQINSNYMTTYNPAYTESEIAVLENPASTTAEKVAIYTAKAKPQLSAADIVILETGTVEERSAVRDAHNLQRFISSGTDGFVSVNDAADPRSNVVINGTAQTRGDTPTGTWSWEVDFLAEEAGTFAHNLTVLAGRS